MELALALIAHACMIVACGQVHFDLVFISFKPRKRNYKDHQSIGRARNRLEMMKNEISNFEILELFFGFSDDG